MTTVIRTITTTVLLSALLVTTSEAEARLKYYRYNANIPMVEMTLNMMVAMGVLEQIPGRLVHDGNPYNRYVRAQYDRYSRTPYTRRASTGYYGGPGYDDYAEWDISPFADYYDHPYGYGSYGLRESPWDYPRGGYRDSPWAYDGLYSSWSGPGSYWGGPYGYGGRYSSWDTPWGNPTINPWSSAWSSAYGSPWNSLYGSQWGTPWNSLWGNRLNSPWTSEWYSPWGGSLNNPWLSPWSGTVLNPFVSPYSSLGNWSGVPGYSSVPGYSGVPGYSVPGYTTQGYPVPDQSTTPVSPDYSQPYRNETPTRAFGHQGASSTSNNGGSVNTHIRTDNSNTGSYTFRKSAASAQPHRYGASGRAAGARYNGESEWRPDRILEGLWISDGGEMLGIRGNRFLWYDGKNRYADGDLLKTPTMMKARISGSDRTVSMKYRVAGNQLYTVSRDGTMRSFSRAPLVQNQIRDRLYNSQSGFRTDAAMPFSGAPAVRPDSGRPHPNTVQRTDPTMSVYPGVNGRAGAARRSLRGEYSPMWGPGLSPARNSATGAGASLSASNGQNRGTGEADVQFESDTGPAVASPARNVGNIWGPAVSLVPYDSDTDRPVVSDSQNRSAEARKQNRQTRPTNGNVYGNAGALRESLTPFSGRRLTLANGLAKVPASYAPSAENNVGTAMRHDTKRVRVLSRQSDDEKSRVGSEGQSSQDPYHYLFSYVKDQSSNTGSESAPQNGNIWKPNKAFPDSRRYRGAAGFYGSSSASAAGMDKAGRADAGEYIWSASNQW